MLSITLGLVTMIAVLTPVYSAPVTTDSEAQILKYTYKNKGNGNYSFSFTTSNGITRQETGTLVNEGLPDEHISVIGSYTYTNPDGKEETVSYIADKNGFIVLEPSEDSIYRSDALLATLLGK